MHRIDNRRRTCLPVFDPFYQSTDRRSRLPLIQQQQQPHTEHRPSSEGRAHAKDAWGKTAKFSGDVDKNVEDSKPSKTKKKLRRVKAVKWRSLNIDSGLGQRSSDSEDSETRGKRGNVAVSVKGTTITQSCEK